MRGPFIFSGKIGGSKRVWFWADTHFHHRNIIDFCGRPFGSVEEMNDEMVRRWNERVGERGEIFFLGDFGFSSKVRETFPLLKGKKHLIIGNHDEKQGKHVLSVGWDSVSHLRVVKWEGKRIVLCHYPIESWPGMHRGWYHFHGHSHGSLRRLLKRRLDVGFEPYPSGPVWIEDALRDSERGDEEMQDGHKREEM